jgi:hypothetical protein
MPEMEYVVNENDVKTDTNKATSSDTMNYIAPITPEEILPETEEDETVLEKSGDRISGSITGLFNKVGTYFKDFFEPTPDHEL